MFVCGFSNFATDAPFSNGQTSMEKYMTSQNDSKKKLTT